MWSPLLHKKRIYVILSTLSARQISSLEISGIADDVVIEGAIDWPSDLLYNAKWGCTSIEIDAVLIAELEE